MQNLIDYIKNSVILVTFNLNPFKWFDNPFYFEHSTHSDMDPGLILELVVKILFLKIVIFIDDGRW